MDNKTNINWYPGHMAKTKRLIKENINLIDIVLLVIDSRVPKSAVIPGLEELINNKPIIYIFTKYDLCDKNETNKFIDMYQKEGKYVLKYDLTKNISVSDLTNYCKTILKDKLEYLNQKGINRNKIRCLCLGIPNSGKSTLINRITGKNSQDTGNKPGVTKNLNWIRINDDLELLDSPGILWPKFEDEVTALNLASTTAIKEEVIPKDKIACYIISFLYKNYPNILEKNYGITNIDDFDEVYTLIAKKRGFIMKGNVPNYDRVTDLIINDIKQGKISGITFDRCGKDEL